MENKDVYYEMRGNGPLWESFCQVPGSQGED